MRDFLRAQEDVVHRFRADLLLTSPEAKLGVATQTLDGRLPVHGLRHPPQADTCGWYIWAGDLSAAHDFFQPMHAAHLEELAPQVLPYLGLGPGWRFLLAPDHEDVWFDAGLLRL